MGRPGKRLVRIAARKLGNGRGHPEARALAGAVLRAARRKR